jgi:hypothetical protein
MPLVEKRPRDYAHGKLKAELNGPNPGLYGGLTSLSKSDLMHVPLHFPKLGVFGHSTLDTPRTLERDFRMRRRKVGVP